jgi:hypothetical protein
MLDTLQGTCSMEYQVHTTIKSKNVKTGEIPVTTTTADTCPPDCAFKDNGCYAGSGPLALHWAKVTSGERGDTWSGFIAKVQSFKDGQLWRHNQAGDLAGDGKRLDADANDQLADANTGKRGFTYTHYPVLTDKHNAQVVKRMNEKGFVVNLSGNNLAHADALYDLDIAPVTTVLPETQTTNTTTPKGRKVIVCPATIRDNVSCATCQLCARNREAIIGFPAHGTSKRKANEVANG